uniref:Uncharacterized protein n=1 Tax=Anguilla anguilla TaxID=7936 RepID=A0A0E9QTV2_ANGAN
MTTTTAPYELFLNVFVPVTFGISRYVVRLKLTTNE